MSSGKIISNLLPICTRCCDGFLHYLNQTFFSINKIVAEAKFSLEIQKLFNELNIGLQEVIWRWFFFNFKKRFPN